jgi:hypothetical protein
LDTCYCYFPAAAEVPVVVVVVVVVVVDTVADIVAAAAAAAVDRWTRTAPSPTSMEAPSTSSTSPLSAAPARMNLKRKTEEEEREQERERARSPSAAVAAVSALLLLLPSSRQEAIKAEALTSSPEEEVPVDCTVVAAVVDSLHPRQEDWYYTRLVEIAAPSSEVGERLFIYSPGKEIKAEERRKRCFVSKPFVYIFSFAKKIRVLEPDRERAERDETSRLFKNRDFLPRSRTVKVLLLLLLLLRRRATVRRRGRWVPAHSRRLLLLFCCRFLLSKKEEREREREKARVLIIARIGTLNERENFVTFFTQKCNQRFFVIIITTDHSLRRLSLRARTTGGRLRRSGEERICA